jgi:hypothetical protein
MVVGDDGDEVDIEIVLDGVRLSGIVTQGGEVAGAGTLVLSPPGEASGPVVMLERDASRRFFGLGGEPLSTSVSVAGEFEFPSVDPGLWIARFSSVGAGASSSVELSVPETAAHSCVLDFPAGTISGVVVDEGDRPVASARVDAHSSRGSQIAFSNAQGSFALSGLPSGPVEMVASARGYTDAEPKTVHINDGRMEESVTLVLRSDTGGSVEGTVRSAVGTVAGAPAFLLGSREGPRFLHESSPVVWESLEPGMYRLCARAYGGAVGCASPVQVDDQRVQVALDIGAGGSVLVQLSEDVGPHPTPQISLPDGSDLTGLAFLGNPPIVSGDQMILGPFAEGRYLVRIVHDAGVMSGMVEVKDGETALLRQ